MQPDPAYASLRRALASRLGSFRYAFAGLAYVLRSQSNARIHLAVAVLVVAASAWLGLSRGEWALLVVTIAIVWTTEILNTAIEAVVDLASPGAHPMAKIAKDCAAAAVLVTAVMAVAVGLLLLGPKLWDRLGF